MEIIKYELDRIADRDYQERAWFNRSPEVSSPTEMICGLLDDYSFEEGSQEPYLEISDAQRAACLRFAHLLKAFSRQHKGRLDEHDVIDDPEWEKIRVAARELIKVLYL
ncbi:MAG: hypothetical protein ACREFL_08775 [Stellaceae bacterium]